jgi:hypothetical protein
MSNVESKGNGMSTSVGRILLAAVVAIVGLWLIFAVIIPTIKALVSILVTIAVFGAVIWLVYKVLTYDSDKSTE